MKDTNESLIDVLRLGLEIRHQSFSQRYRSEAQTSDRAYGKAARCRGDMGRLATELTLELTGQLIPCRVIFALSNKFSW
jgi:hypothetical protein